MISELQSTIRDLFSKDKGLLAMDESNPTCDERFARLGIPQTPEFRRDYRELIVTTPNLGEAVGGAILFDETIRQTLHDGTPFAKALEKRGIIPGIKVDAGAKDLALFPGEKITEGLDGLRERLHDYRQMGARFAKWRAVISIGDKTPTRGCIQVNASALGRYAALCQEVGIVPIVEPEVLMTGNHDLQACADVTERTIRAVFDQLLIQNVELSAVILKPNMVTRGSQSPTSATIAEVAEATVAVLLRSVPYRVPAIAFLSGGQSAELATARLNEMNRRYRAEVPWQISFSFSRAVQQHALELWHGQLANVQESQKELYHRVRDNQIARQGRFNLSMNEASAL